MGFGASEESIFCSFGVLRIKILFLWVLRGFETQYHHVVADLKDKMGAKFQSEGQLFVQLGQNTLVVQAVVIITQKEAKFGARRGQCPLVAELG